MGGLRPALLLGAHERAKGLAVVSRRDVRTRGKLLPCKNLNVTPLTPTNTRHWATLSTSEAVTHTVLVSLLLFTILSIAQLQEPVVIGLVAGACGLVAYGLTLLIRSVRR